MTYRTIEENSVFRAEKEYGKFIAKKIIPTPTKKREFYMYENKVFINDGYVTFNIIELDRTIGKITVNINNTGHHAIDTFELKDLDGWTYFEYGRPVPEKIYIDDFREVLK